MSPLANAYHEVRLGLFDLETRIEKALIEKRPLQRVGAFVFQRIRELSELETIPEDIRVLARSVVVMVEKGKVH